MLLFNTCLDHHGLYSTYHRLGCWSTLRGPTTLLQDDLADENNPVDDDGVAEEGVRFTLSSSAMRVKLCSVQCLLGYLVPSSDS